jgi:hypothetical protein
VVLPLVQSPAIIDRLNPGPCTPTVIAVDPNWPVFDTVKVSIVVEPAVTVPKSVDDPGAGASVSVALTEHIPAEQAVLVAVQVLPAQHGCPEAPHIRQPPPEHAVPDAVQALPAQHGPLRPPQAAQVDPKQTVPEAVHEFPPQHDWLAPPQATHVPAPPHTVPAPQLVLPLVQHGRPSDPQAMHWPPVPQIAALPQAGVPLQQASPEAPHAMQTLAVPQMATPAAHVEPQHGWPTPPHPPQVPFWQTSLVELQAPPQQGWPVPPQAVQLPVAPHVSPEPHGLLPVQHGWAAPPHAAQVPPEHTVPAAVHDVPAQHG